VSDLVTRRSNHAEPRSPRGIAQHYLRDMVYGALDGLITTFAAVAGVAGGALAPTTVLIVGIANLAADGLSMAVGNYLSIKSNESVRAAQDLPEEEARPARHGIATFVAFTLVGAFPLLPYVLAPTSSHRFGLATGVTLVALFVVGASRSIVTRERWWVSGAEMFGLGVVVAAVAYGAGRFVAGLVGAS
jgi:VIT1/CCC1 family predicted Fe2+/Mn2+ transporter